MTSRLLDTTVLIDLSRGNTDAADFTDAIRVSGTRLLISVISTMGLIVDAEIEVRWKRRRN